MDMGSTYLLSHFMESHFDINLSNPFKISSAQNMKILIASMSQIDILKR